MGEMLATLFSNAPAVLCLILGYGLLLLEICMPGFGVPGMLGVLLVIGGVLTGATGAEHQLMLAGLMLALVLAAVPVCLRFIGKGRFAKSKLVLSDVSVPVKDQPHDLDQYLGRSGEALTPLRPAGIGAFDGVKLDVVSDGAFIPEGARVRVERVEGNRVVVTVIE